METKLLSVKGYKIWLGPYIALPLGKEGSLSCNECCDMGTTLFFWGGGGPHLKDRPILVTSDDKQGVSGLILTRVPQEKNSMFI